MRVSGLYITLRFLLSMRYVHIYNHKNVLIYSISIYERKAVLSRALLAERIKFVNYDMVKILKYYIHPNKIDENFP